MDTLGLYFSVPFCRAKCSFCNFASGVFASGRMEHYIAQVCAELEASRAQATQMGAELPSVVDSIYLGGGTPSLLPPELLQRMFATIRANFEVTPDAEITVEAAPGQIQDATLEAMLQNGVNRISLGVQSFIDAEAAAIGRLHTRKMCENEVQRLRAAGLQQVGVDLIAGLPHQDAASWNESLNAAIGLTLPHVSVYMLEVDEDSRLGREVLAGGTKFHAHFVPDADISADLYVQACERLNEAGLSQYEISNFGAPSRHNVKYWKRKPYLGCGLDAHSMLRSGETAVRFSNVDDMGEYESGHIGDVHTLTREEALEESVFLGLRLVEGISTATLPAQFKDQCGAAVADLIEAGLLEVTADNWKLTQRGRLLSNEVFSRLLVEEGTAAF